MSPTVFGHRPIYSNYQSIDQQHVLYNRASKKIFFSSQNVPLFFSTLPRGRGLNAKHHLEADFEVMQRHQRARSLEHILDGGGRHHVVDGVDHVGGQGHPHVGGLSGGLNSGASQSIRNMGPNYWVADGAKLISRKRGHATPVLNKRPQYQQHQQRASSVERMLDESSLDTNSTSVPSYW